MEEVMEGRMSRKDPALFESNAPLNYSFTLVLRYILHVLRPPRSITIYLDSIVNSEPDKCSGHPEEAAIGKPHELLNVTPAVE